MSNGGYILNFFPFALYLPDVVIKENALTVLFEGVSEQIKLKNKNTWKISIKIPKWDYVKNKPGLLTF